MSEMTAESLRDSNYFVGFWEGLDPLDGAVCYRSIVPTVSGDNQYVYVGRQEYFQLCAAFPSENRNVSEEPEASSELIPGVLNSFGTIDDKGLFQVQPNLTCVGEEEPRVIGITAWYEYLSDNVMIERAPFRIDSPIYFFRNSKEYNAGKISSAISVSNSIWYISPFLVLFTAFFLHRV
mmetsp:Transcript_24700/g.44723  ORF Transcript_24700/g.44723 Transcript_24700/m.44723 type:complete len:179 (+) Transcript_24700:183-719(+)